MTLTVEEMNLIAIYRQGSRRATIENIMGIMSLIEDEEMRVLAEQTLTVLERMTDEELAGMVVVAVGEHDEEIETA